MRDNLIPPDGPSDEGIATLREAGPLGMIMLRASIGSEHVEKAVKSITGADLPGRRLMRRAGDCAVVWMSPDEYLLIVPKDAVHGALATIATTLDGTHHLAADVSDARAVFRIEGPRAAEVIARISPVDIAHLTADEVRRTRAAQVAAALWREDDGFTLVCFRSVARYVHDLLANAARSG